MEQDRAKYSDTGSTAKTIVPTEIFDVSCDFSLLNLNTLASARAGHK
jgi:hypothetical protein